MIVLIVIIVLLIILLATLMWIRKLCFMPDPNEQDMDVKFSRKHPELVGPAKKKIAALLELPYEDVWITSFDGLRLHGYYYHVCDGAPLEICFHGYRGTARRDFSGGAQLFRGLGHNVLLVDQRAQGQSEGKYMGFGILERKDLLKWVEYALSRFGESQKIILVGISMGGATVLMASGLALPENVKAIFADCPYSSAVDVIKRVEKVNMHLPEFVIGFVKLSSRLFCRYDLAECRADEEIKKCNIPVLIIHGAEDNFVPAYMSESVQQARPDIVERHLFDGADHGASYLVDKERYERIVSDFIKKVI